MLVIDVEQAGVARIATRLVERPAGKGVLSEKCGNGMLLRQRDELLPDGRIDLVSQLVQSACQTIASEGLRSRTVPPAFGRLPDHGPSTPLIP